MSDELQALCFLAGANSIFYGEKLLTTGNPDTTRDRDLLARLGLTAAGHEAGRAGA
jgi:biotin synthase